MRAWTGNQINILLLLALSLSSCSARPPEDKVDTKKEEVEVVEQQENSPEVEVSKPLYIYKDQKGENPEQIVLEIDGGPLLLLSGYVRLAGVVSGEMPLALIEVAGRGRLVKEGEKIGGYAVVSISSRSVLMKKYKEGG